MSDFSAVHSWFSDILFSLVQVKVLKAIRPVDVKDVVVGQYVANAECPREFVHFQFCFGKSVGPESWKDVSLADFIVIDVNRPLASNLVPEPWIDVSQWIDEI